MAITMRHVAAIRTCSGLVCHRSSPCGTESLHRCSTARTLVGVGTGLAEGILSLRHHPGPVSLRPASRESARLAIADTQESAVTVISISTNYVAVDFAMRFSGLRSTASAHWAWPAPTSMAVCRRETHCGTTILGCYSHVRGGILHPRCISAKGETGVS